jgi:hypothetical protein
MYCPQCGQTQTGEVRYCSRCGLSIQEVALWLAGTGELVNPQAQPAVSRRRKHIMLAARVAFFSVVSFPLFLFIGLMDSEEGWLIPPVLVFFVSLMWMLYSRLFIDGRVTTATSPQPSLRAEETNYLPPRQARELEPHRTTTSEIIQPTSVTEYTTNLLKKK